MLIISNRPAVTIGSSVSGARDRGARGIAEREALRDERAAAISTLVEATSRSPAVSSRRIACAELHEPGARLLVDAGLVADDLLLDVGRREVELDGNHALARRVLQVLEHALVSGVVGHDEAEARRGVERDAEAIDRQLAPMVGERVEHDGRVLTGFDDLVEVADGAVAHGAGERAVDPRGLARLQQEPADEVGGREVVMARHCDERTLEVVGHRLDEARLPAPRRTLEEDGQTPLVRGAKDALLVPHGHVVRPRCLCHPVVPPLAASR